VSDADRAEGDSSDAANDLRQEQDANNASADYCWGGTPPSRTGRKQQQEQQQQPEPLLQFSAAWSVFEQQLAMLHSRQRLLILATSQLPVEELPHEMQQLFGWRQQQQQQRRWDATAAAGADSSDGWRHVSCSSSRTVQVCDHVTAGACASNSTAAAKAALTTAVDRAMQMAASALHSGNGSGTGGANGFADAAKPARELQASTGSSQLTEGWLQRHDTASRTGADALDSHRQQQRAPVDALIAAALRQKEQQQRQMQRQLSARVPTQQMLAAQQLAAPLQQLNDAKRAEALTLLDQVGCIPPHTDCCPVVVWA
jgi:hypothetical protein